MLNFPTAPVCAFSLNYAHIQTFAVSPLMFPPCGAKHVQKEYIQTNQRETIAISVYMCNIFPLIGTSMVYTIPLDLMENSFKSGCIRSVFSMVLT